MIRFDKNSESFDTVGLPTSRVVGTTLSILLFILIVVNPIPVKGADDILRVGINASGIQTLDPHFAASFADRMIVDMVFNALIHYKPGQAPQFEPDLADAIPEPVIIEGLQTWTFNLKHHVYFHPGPKTPAYELTADDVIYSFEKASDPQRSAYSGEYSGMHIKKIDDYTCRFILDHPLSPTLFFTKVANYAGGFIVCKHAVEALGDDAVGKWPIGTGPFMLAKHQPDQMMQLAANRAYFRGVPRLQGVEIYYLPIASECESRFFQGQLDVIRGISLSNWITRIRTQPNVIVDIFGVSEVANIFFNTTVKPLDDRRVRQAIAFALDRDEFLAPFGTEGAVNVYAPIPAQFLPGGLRAEEVQALKLDYARDIDRSRQLLADAGYPDGFEMDVFVSELHQIRTNYESLKKQLAPIKVKLNLHLVDHSKMHQFIRQDLNPIVIYEAWRPNTDVYLQQFFHSDSIVLSGKKPDTNFSHYRLLDDIIEKARRESDPMKQVKLWKYAQVKLLEDMVVYPLHYRPKVYIRRSNVDYGHPLEASIALYPQFTELTRIMR